MRTEGNAEASMRRMADVVAISTLLNRYAQALDGTDSETWLACFEVDATFVAAQSDAPDVLGMNLAGIDDLRAWIIGYHDVHNAPFRSKHFLSHPVVDFVDDDEATSVTYFVTQGPAPDGGIRMMTNGRYLDRLRRGPSGTWRFRARLALRDLAATDIPAWR